MKNNYSGKVESADVNAGSSWQDTLELHRTFGWYDFVIEVSQDSNFRYQVAGHVETGEESTTDPAIGA